MAFTAAKATRVLTIDERNGAGLTELSIHHVAVICSDYELRHLAFCVADINAWKAKLGSFGVETEPIRTDEYTQSRYTFFADPDGLPIELYEVVSVAFGG
jgi:hypothetical protein